MILRFWDLICSVRGTVAATHRVPFQQPRLRRFAELNTKIALKFDFESNAFVSINGRRANYQSRLAGSTIGNAESAAAYRAGSGLDACTAQADRRQIFAAD